FVAGNWYVLVRFCPFRYSSRVADVASNGEFGVRLVAALPLVVVCHLMACGRGSNEHGHLETTAAQQSQNARRFVAFHQSTFLIDALEVPFAPPTTAGSTLAPDLLSSSASDIVSVDAAANLIAHKNGTAVV